MSDSNLTATFLTPSSNPNPICTHIMELNSDPLDFEHFFLLPQPETASTSLSPVNPGGSASVDYTLQTNEGYATTTEGEVKIAFRTKSGVEVMDDGYKWRKYGKKVIKDNPNPSFNHHHHHHMFMLPRKIIFMHMYVCDEVQALLPVLRGRMQGEEKGGKGQGRWALCDNDIQGEA
ncbi:Detected protein of unknown function [Hibiscus syriacus]|uniref:WRKY domain-containing protein n=1 Tax=Hibiscus syriacus TaxID=106335 RepID=A0A6A2Z034_HIBSY|nr:Detected protein of unknown function [Hibiscus syriacus]